MSDLRFLQNISIEELCQIKGVGKVKAIQIIATCELAKRMMSPSDVQSIIIRNSQDIANLLMNEMKYEKREIAKIILLNSKNIVQKIIDISYGGTNFAMLEPKDVLHEAIKISAPKIIIVHNHPTGEVNPSFQDIQITKRIKEAAQILGIQLLDHIIIGDGKFKSLL